MKAPALLLILGLSLTTVILASETIRDLPANLEIVAQDSLYVTILDKETGLTYQRLYKPEPWLAADAGEPNGEITLPPVTANFDTCFSFVKKWRLPSNMGYHQFGECDRDGLTEISGILGGSTLIFERPEDDSLFQQRGQLSGRAVMDYGGDADGDGRREMMSIRWHSTSISYMVLDEASDTASLPSDSVYAWPLHLGAPRVMAGGFTDLDGDGITEISFRPTYRVIYALRNVGDNAYVLDYTIPYPESLIDNYSEYVWGDFDADLLPEVVTVGSMGRVLCYEQAAPDSFALVWRALLRHWNTFWLVGPADLDADGVWEFYCMSASPQGGGFFFFGFESDGDNSFNQFWVDSLPGSIFSIGGSLALQDFDGDGGQELMVCSNGRLGVYGPRADGTMGALYLKRSVYNTPSAYDTDHDGLGEIFIERPVPAGHNVYEFTYGEAYRGDMNADCLVNGLDVIYFINYLKGREEYPLPSDIYKADINGNCQVNGIDVVYLVWYLKGGPVPIDRECQ